MPRLPDSRDGLVFRLYRDESDFPGMAAAFNAARAADGIKEVESVAEFTNAYRHLTNCDLATDALILERDGSIVGYSRVTWSVEAATSDRVLLAVWFLRPETRRPGVTEAVLGWAEARLAEIAAAHPHQGCQYFTGYVDEVEATRHQVLTAAGYQRTQTYAEMVRPLSEPIPEFALPDGLELRPVTWEHGRAIWEANDRAFRDHVGYTPQTETDYEWWRNFEFADPSLWKVAFAGDSIAGQVLNYVDTMQNTTFHRSWGWTENISVQREWRQHGVAKALIAESMRMFRDLGMTHVALGVHTTNPNGAFPLYEGLGYRVTTRTFEVRKPFLPDAAAQPS